MQGNIFQRTLEASDRNADRMDQTRGRSVPSTKLSAHGDIKQSVAKVEKRLQIEQKLHAARLRREAHLRVREASSRAANIKQAQVSHAAAKRRNVEDAERETRAFSLERSSAEQVLLRKVRRGSSVCSYHDALSHI